MPCYQRCVKSTSSRGLVLDACRRKRGALKSPTVCSKTPRHLGPQVHIPFIGQPMNPLPQLVLVLLHRQRTRPQASPKVAAQSPSSLHKTHFAQEGCRSTHAMHSNQYATLLATPHNISGKSQDSCSRCSAEFQPHSQCTCLILCPPASVHRSPSHHRKYW